MAVTDPQAIAFAAKVRQAMDAVVTACATCAVLEQNWNNGISALFPNTSVVVADGAAPNGVDATGGDGRRVLTGIDVNNAMNRAVEMQNLMNTGLITGGVANAGWYNTVMKPSVNGRSVL